MKKKLSDQQRADLQARKVTLESSIAALQSNPSRSAEQEEELQAGQSEVEAIDGKIELDDVIAENQRLGSAMIAERTREAEAEVKKAVARGAIAAKDSATQDRWKALVIEDPDKNKPLLAAMRGSAAMDRARLTVQQVRITREDNSAILARMAELNERNTGERNYRNKLPLAHDFSTIYAREILPRLKEGDDIPISADNNFGTLAQTLVSTRILELLTLDFPMLDAVSTDFSDQIVNFGDTINTTIKGIPSVVSYNTTTGWSDSDQVDVQVPITYDQHRGVQVQVNEQIVASTIRNLLEESAPPQAYALGKDMVDHLYTRITAANYPGVSLTLSSTGVAIATLAVSGANFGRPNVIDLEGALDDMANPPKRMLLLNRVYYSALEKDPALIQLGVFQRAGIITDSNSLPNVAGFNLVKAVNLPATAIGGQTLKGFGLTKSALVTGSRLTANYMSLIPGAANGIATVIRTPGGRAANLVAYVDNKLGRAYQRLSIMYGDAKGQANAGIILTDV